MNLKINHIRYITGFLDVGFDAGKTSQFIETEIDEKFKSIQYPELYSWESKPEIVSKSFDNGYQLRKRKTYPKKIYTEIVIHLPILNLTE